MILAGHYLDEGVGTGTNGGGGGGGRNVFGENLGGG